MNLTDVMIPVAALATIVVLPVTQLIRNMLRLDGWPVLLLSVGVGVVSGAMLAAGGVTDLQTLTLYPPALSGAVLGWLAGLTASGGKAVVTSIQTNGAQARAKAAAAVECETPVTPNSERPAPNTQQSTPNTQQPPNPTEVSSDPTTEASTEPEGDWQPASLSDLAQTRTDWPALPLPDDAPPAPEPPR